MTPLVRVTLAYMAGLVVPFYLVPRVSEYMEAWWMASVVAACVVVGLFLVARSRGGAERGGARSVLGLFFILGVFAGGAARTASDSDCRSLFRNGASVVFAGQPASLPGADGNFTLALVRSASPGVSQCSGMVRAKMQRGVPMELRDGRAISGRGVWMTFDVPARLPMPPERRGMLLVQGAAAAPPSMRVSRMLAMRVHAQVVLRAMLKQSGLAEALVLAQREGVDKKVNEQFTATGLSHLLSISGTHVGLVAALLLGLAAFLRINGNAGRIGATVGVIAYVVFLGAPAAAARSALQVMMLLAGRMLQRPSDPYAVLAGAALILLVLQPLNLLDAGFQLSFAGVIGLIAYRRKVADRLPRRMPAWLRDGIAASVAASGVTIPIAAFHFGQIALVGVPASLIAVPLCGFAIPAVTLVLLLAGISQPLARFFGAGADVLLTLMERVAAVAFDVPGGHVPLSWTSLIAMLVMAAGVVLALASQREKGWKARARRRIHDSVDVVARDERRALRFRVAACAAACVACGAWVPQLTGIGRGAVEIHAIDVGQGDALAIRTPHGHWVLVDAGPRTPTFDAGKSRVVPYLLKHGVRRLDAIVITHPDADHIGGVASVLRGIGSVAIIDPATAAGKPLYIQTMEAADSSGLRWYKSRDGHRLDVDGVRLDFLFPQSDSLDGTGDPNDLSLAFRMGFGRFTAMFMGDAPVSTEDRIVDEYGTRIASVVLKVGHHGSYTSSSDRFLAAVRPELALISVGRGNRYGHPNPGVMARLLRRGIRVLRTDEHGAVVVKGRADGSFRVVTQR